MAKGNKVLALLRVGLMQVRILVTAERKKCLEHRKAPCS